jgi:hypothetical protein
MDKYDIYIPAGEKAVGQLRVKRLIEGLDDTKGWDVQIRQHRKKRSLDANAYFWKLLDELSSRLHEGTTEIYRSYIKEIGGNSEIVCVKNEAVKTLIRVWQSKGLGWRTETMPSKLQGCTNVILYYGSSAFDTAQMSRLIDMVVQDCITLGIPTKQPEELEELIKQWGCE